MERRTLVPDSGIGDRRHVVWWRLVSAVAAAAILLAACGGGSQELASLDEDLADAAATAAADDGRLHLRDVTDVEWDVLGVFGPYTSPEEVDRQLGVGMPAAAERGMNSDSDVFLAFVDGGDLAAWALLGRGRIAVPPPAGVYRAEEAIFAVEPWGGGTFRLAAIETVP